MIARRRIAEQQRMRLLDVNRRNAERLREMCSRIFD
jgi:hypothetical protein